MRSLRRGLLLAFALLAVTATPAPGADWIAPFPLTQPGVTVPQKLSPLVAMAPNGDATAVWIEIGDCDNGSCSEEHVMAAQVRADGVAHDVYRLSGPNAVPGMPDSATRPHLAVDAAGRARVVWLRRDPDRNYRAEMATLDANGDPVGPAEFVSPAGRSAVDVGLGMNDAGQGVVLWVDDALRARRFDATGFVSGETIVHPVAPDHQFVAPVAAVDAAGDATIAWNDELHQLPTVATTVLARRLSLTTGLGLMHTLATWSVAINEPVALDVHPASGKATLLWSNFANGSQPDSVAGAQITAGDALEFLPFSFDSGGRPDVAVAPDGRVVAVFDMLPDGQTPPRRIIAIRIGADGTVGSPLFVSEDGEEGIDPDVDVAPDGTAFVGWHEGSGFRRLLAARIPAGAPAQDLEPLAFDVSFGPTPTVAADRNGSALTISAYGIGTEQVVQAQYFDGEPPVITTFGLPVRGLVGQQLWFGAVIRDELSATGNETWTFGDGTGGSAPVLAHAFARPGIFAVTLRAEDDAGNPVSRRGAVTISLPQPVQVPGGRPATPQFTADLPPRLQRRVLLRRGLPVEVAAATPTGFTVELLGRLRGVRLASAGDVVLAERTLGAAPGTRTARLRVSPGLRRMVRRGARLRVQITATGADGGTAAITRRVRVR